MAPPTRTPANKWIEAGLRALARGGPDGVRVEALARTLGVTKGGFYNHFDDRPALLDEMLDAWERVGVDNVIERVNAGGGDGRQKLRRLFEVSSSARDLIGIELAIRDWARREPVVARRLKRVDSRRLDYVRALFRDFCADAEEVEMRSLVVMSLYLGVPSLSADYGPRRRGELHKRAFERLLDGQ